MIFFTPKQKENIVNMKNHLDDISLLSQEEQLSYYKKLSSHYEKKLIDCHEIAVELVGSREANKPSLTTIVRKISHATKDAVDSHVAKTGYKPNNLESIESNR